MVKTLVSFLGLYMAFLSYQWDAWLLALKQVSPVLYDQLYVAIMKSIACLYTDDLLPTREKLADLVDISLYFSA